MAGFPKIRFEPGPLPSWVAPILIVLTLVSFIPLAVIANKRVTDMSHPRMRIVPDMDKQEKFRSQRANPMFADGRAMRMPPAGAVARGEARLDPHWNEGKVQGQWATKFPTPVTAETMRRGQDRFNIYCSPCHGLTGAGDGMVNLRAERLQEGTWTPPSNLASDVVTARPVGHLFNTITNGIRSMPPYGPQIPEDDRWAIVAYVRALQRSQNATLSDVPVDQRSNLH
jgi:mono/diheme cytochrome c family protein